MPVGSLNLVYITVLYVLIQLSLSLPLALPLLSSRSRCTPLSPPASRLSYTTVKVPGSSPLHSDEQDKFEQELL